jgi:hypothetical protein
LPGFARTDSLHRFSRAALAGERNIRCFGVMPAAERFLVREAETGADIIRDVLDRLH